MLHVSGEFIVDDMIESSVMMVFVACCDLTNLGI
jgi:hypothetical protein